MKVVSVVLLIFYILEGAGALTVDINIDMEAVVGPSDIQVNCSYVADAGDLLFGINLKVFSEGMFKTIAIFSPMNSALPAFTTDGQYLVNRSSLINPNGGLNTAILTFSQITCEDETVYQCEVDYQDGDTGMIPSPLPTDSTNLTVKSAAERPDTAPLMSVESGIEEGQNVTFTCFGNVGNPPGTFIWEKFRMIGFFPTTYPDEPTIISEIPGGCSYNGTSSLTITMEEGDNNAVVRCKVSQELSATNLLQQTTPINVLFSVREIGIVSVPDHPTYIEGSDPVTLYCSGAGNPLPSYTWYKDGKVVSSSPVHIINDVITGNSGNYTCTTANLINGISNSESLSTTIIIETGPVTYPTTTSSVPGMFPTTTAALLIYLQSVYRLYIDI